MTNPEIASRMKTFNDLLIKSEGYVFACGYMEVFMGEVLTAYVPANLRHELITMLDKRIKTYEEGKYNEGL